MNNDFRRKENRLDTSVYQERHIYHLTLSCSGEEARFTEEVVQQNLEVLKDSSEKHDTKVHAYCFMPDHLHLLVEGDELVKFVKEFKQLTGYRYKQKTEEKLWQKSYYDHILREKEEVKKVADYIFKNPVREGLVENFLEYPYSGSFEFNKDDI